MSEIISMQQFGINGGKIIIHKVTETSTLISFIRNQFMRNQDTTQKVENQNMFNPREIKRSQKRDFKETFRAEHRGSFE